MSENKKLSVVQIIDTLEPGGAERVLITWANILFSHGHAVGVITTLKKGKLASQLSYGIELRELKRKSKWNLKSMKQLIEWCKPFDVVHVHSTHNLRYLFLAAKIFKLNKKIFFHHHYGNIETDQSISVSQRFIYPKINLIAVSKKMYDWAIDKLKMPAAKTFLLSNIVIPNYVAEKKVFNRDDKRIQLLLVSNFRPQKNIEFAVDLINELKNDLNVHLTIIGQTANEKYWNSVQRKTNAMQLKEYISIIHDCDNIQSVLNNFHLAIHTATSESGPLVLIEYMMAGLPFLSYKTGEVVHQIANDLPQCIVDTFNIHEWVSRINHLLQQNKNELSIKLKSSFNKYYSEETYYNNCIDIYNEGLQLK
jgi:glycosyltransferase involved in cell wall biosynthesis